MSLEKFWQKRFSRFAEKYNEDHLIAGWSKQGLQRRLETYLKIFKKLDLPKDALILDLGCGAGTYCRALKRLGYHNIIGLDYSFSVLKKAKNKDSTILFLGGDIYNLPFKTNTFHHIICIGVFQSLTQEKIALQEINRILKKGGTLILGALNSIELYYIIKNKFRSINQNLKRYHPSYLKRLLENTGFGYPLCKGVYIFPIYLRILNKLIPHFFELPLSFAHSILIIAIK